MAKVTIQTHNVTVQSTTGRSTFSITYEGCTPGSIDITNYGGTDIIYGATLNASGNLVIQWNANTQASGRAVLIIVQANVTGGGTVEDALAFNQQGSQYNVSINGPRDIEGDEGSGTYSITSTIGGNYAAYTYHNSDWLTVQTITKTSSNAGSMILSYTQNDGDARFGVVRFQFNYQYNPYYAFYLMIITQGTYVQRESQLYYSPNTSNVSYNAGTLTTSAPVMENVGSLTVRSVSGDMDIQSVDIDSSNGVLVVRYGANTGDGVLNATIMVRGTGVSGYVSTTYYIYQGSYQFLVNPIWQTTTVDVAGRSYVDYTIDTEGQTIYSGRAYQMPGEDSISFELNEIVRDYLDNTLWWREGYQTPSGWQRSFSLSMDSGDGGEYVFTKDWSYKNLSYSSSQFISLNEPIINEIPAGCYVPVCVFSPQKAGNTSFTRNGTSVYTANLNNPRQARYLFVSAPGYKYGYTGNNNIYKGAADCKTRYVLYYENAYGGIDAMPVQGNATLTDKITAYTTKNAVRVPSTTFSYRRYLNEIQKTWEFRTGYLSDEQASRMHHLIESTMAYVYDIETDALYPVVIDETSLTYKTYKNQGRKFFNYSFKVRESQDKIRK